VPERRTYFRWSYVLAGIVFVPAPAALKIAGHVGFFIAFLAPLFGIAACVVANFDEKKTTSSVEQRVIWFVAILAVLLSILEFFWTNHPVWLNDLQG
jgi:vacuolar-type H+-ATPase subunit I/STV1